MIFGHTGRGGLVAVNAANAFRAVPTLALLTLLAIQPSISLKWGGFLASWIALTALAIPPILTNTYVGMREVDADVRDAAKAVGLTGGQVLRRVEATARGAVRDGRSTHGGHRGGRHLHPGRIRQLLGPRDLRHQRPQHPEHRAFAGALLVGVMAALVALGLGLLTRAVTPIPFGRASAYASARRRGDRRGLAHRTLDKSDGISHYLCSYGVYIADLITMARSKFGVSAVRGKGMPDALQAFAVDLGRSGAGRHSGRPRPRVALAASSKPTIVIGSTNFEEQAIVSNIWATS